jgi:hypothetical protein
MPRPVHSPVFPFLPMYERRSDPLAPFPKFARRMGISGLVAAAVLGGGLLLGILGYHFIGRLSWVDAVLNASMILTGMGPVNPLTTAAAKLFASAYALFSGVVFLSAMSILLAPAFHRLIHHFHFDGTTAAAKPKSKTA